MKILCLSLLLLAVCCQLEVDADCPASHFDLIGTYTIGKQDQLNRTFQHLQDRITEIGNVTFNYTATTVYQIYNAKPIFYYRDSKQQGKIRGNDTIVIFGGKVEVDITFQWKKTNIVTRNGTGSAFGLSDQISFAKQLVVENGSSYSYELLDWQDVTWNNGEVFQLTRIDPASATDEDKTVLTRMLNNILGIKTIRNLLEEEIDKVFSYYLKVCLHDEHFHFNPQFDYIWAPGGSRSNITISMIRRAISVDVEQDGIRATFDVQAEKATDWKCAERSVPSLPLNPNVYGHTQQFISYDFYLNMLNFAIGQNYFDTTLEREPWESDMFQFFAGDLYQIFPLLQTKFYATEQINGNCKATYTGLKVWKADYDTFNVSLHFDCQLNIRREKLVDFSVGLQAQIRGIPDQNHLNFKLLNHEEFTSFYPYGQYKIQNEDLAKLMVKHSLNRLYESNIFGSGFPYSPPKDFPHFIAEDNCTIVYDSTHVDPHLRALDDGEYIELEDI